MSALDKNRYLNSTYLLYSCFFIMLLMMLFIKYIHFEPIEFGVINQILHPEYPKGQIAYSPQNNYDYIVVFITKLLGYAANLESLAKLIWFLEMILAIFVLIKICNFLFKNNKLILLMVIMLFILNPSGQIDQKTMAMPLYLLAIYFFLKGRWFMSALFGASIFYLHVGLAVWWSSASCLALAVMFFVQKKISIKQIITYPIIIIAGTFPIVYFFLNSISNARIDAFSAQYIYHLCWYCSSSSMTFTNVPWIISASLMIGIIFVGYLKANRAGYINHNIMPIVIGVFALYLINFIFSDMLQNTTIIILQLLRSIIYVEFFFSLFFAFLLARQIMKGNYFFFSIFILFFSRHSIFGKFLGNVDYYSSLNIFYFPLLLYEIFAPFIDSFVGRMFENFDKKDNMIHFKRITDGKKQLFQQPVTIAILFIFLTIPKLPLTLKQQIKSVLHIQQPKIAIASNKHESLYNDVIRFTNQKITDKNAIFLIPFLETDFEYYTKHKIFITYSMPINIVQYKNNIFNFKYILENDLGQSAKNFFQNYSDNNFREKWEGLWINLNEDLIRHWKKEYGVNYVIRERDLPLNFPVIYKNQYFLVYEIK